MDCGGDLVRFAKPAHGQFFESWAISRVSAASAAFDVEYAAPAKGCTRLPAIDVTLTTAPLATVSSAFNPRASTTDAKKFTWKT